MAVAAVVHVETPIRRIGYGEGEPTYQSGSVPLHPICSHPLAKSTSPRTRGEV